MNGSECIDSKCVCPAGFVGDRCQFTSEELPALTAAVTDMMNTISQDAQSMPSE